MDSSGLAIYCSDEITRDALPVRGVRWVLTWAGTIAVLVLAATILASLAFQLAAERKLANAVAAGLREAALPRATSESVAAAVRLRLGQGGGLTRATTLRLEQNGKPLHGAVHIKSGDQVTISLSVPARVVMPRWLPMQAWLSAGTVQWHAEQRVN